MTWVSGKKIFNFPRDSHVLSRLRTTTLSTLHVWWVVIPVLTGKSRTIFSNKIFHLLLERGEGREKEKERNINVRARLPLIHALARDQTPASQACALTGIKPATFRFVV